MTRRLLGPGLVALILIGCFAGRVPDDAARRQARAHRGSFVETLALTGEVDAARGDIISVPMLPSWMTSIKWVADDGSDVRRGDRVVELDNSQFTGDLDAKRQAVTNAQQELQQSDAQAQADLLQKQLDVEKDRADFEKAKLDAAIPPEIVSARDFEDRQVKLKRATVELAKARAILRSQLTGAHSDRANLLLKLATAQRDLQTAETAIAALVLRAPRDGIVVLKDAPMVAVGNSVGGGSRKVKEGDPVFVGFPLALLPDPTSLQIAAALPDVDDGKIAVGMPATAVLDAYPDLSFPGRVVEISSVAQESRDRTSLRRWFRVVIKLDHLDLTRMRPGLSARVTVRRAAIGNALLVPRERVDFSSPHPTVRAKPVRLGPCNPQECVVLSGLEEGQ